MKKLILALTVFLLVGCGADSDNTLIQYTGTSDGVYTFSMGGGTEYEGSITQESNIENDIVDVLTENTSTFSIDVDTASYAHFRGYLNNGVLPLANTIRTEEFINYFNYNYEPPTGDLPYSITTEVSQNPWNTDRLLFMIGIQGKEIPMAELPPNNLVFLLDVSGSMGAEDKLPLVIESFKLLVDTLREEDTVSIVVYAGAAGVVLPPTSGSEKELIKAALDSLEAGGSTAGGEGINLAYDLAFENFEFNGNNRILLATDGDFNVGVSNTTALIALIEEKNEIGIYLSILGFGSNAFNDSLTESLSNAGDGNCYYIDSIVEAEKVLVSEMMGTLLTIADDVKIQVEFNPDVVKGYRLIGYENRVLDNDEFDDDNVDAGDLGAGQSVTAVYELILVNSTEDLDEIDDTLYNDVEFVGTDIIATVRIRYKEIGEDESKLVEEVVLVNTITSTPSTNFLFVSSVIEVTNVLTDSKYKGTSSYQTALQRIEDNLGVDFRGYRYEFLGLVEKLIVFHE
ncbi:MAG: von Willebrand factor type A domain-containing protein [Candidatus Izemoplasma sp.]